MANKCFTWESLTSSVDSNFTSTYSNFSLSPSIENYYSDQGYSGKKLITWGGVSDLVSEISNNDVILCISDDDSSVIFPVIYYTSTDGDSTTGTKSLVSATTPLTIYKGYYVMVEDGGGSLDVTGSSVETELQTCVNNAELVSYYSTDLPTSWTRTFEADYIIINSISSSSSYNIKSSHYLGETSSSLTLESTTTYSSDNLPISMSAITNYDNFNLYPYHKFVFTISSAKYGGTIGNIVLSDSDGNLSQITVDEFTTNGIDSDQTPIGVVAISPELTDDGVPRVMALKYGSLDDPDNGDISTVSMYWGGYGLTTGNNYYTLCNYVNSDGELSGTSSAAYFPREEQTTSSLNVLSPAGMYWYSSVTYYGPDPVTSDWSGKNDYYYDTSVAHGDFLGKANTELLIQLATSLSDWKTSSINNSYSSGYFPAACSCWRYYTEGTSLGDWYLPAAGELLFMSMFRVTLNTALSALSSAGYSVASVESSGTFWSSTEFSANGARPVNLYYGSLYSDGVKYGTAYVRPFAALTIQ